MFFCKTNLLHQLAQPIDRGLRLWDGKFLFGENKTYRGFIFMVIICACAQVLWGWMVGSNTYLYNHSYVAQYNNTIVFNIILGALLGFIYMISELPNSFIKRRFDIAPGKTSKGAMKWLFVAIDQIDSLFGVIALICLFHHVSVWMYIVIVIIGGITHFVINNILYLLKLRKNRF